MIGLQEDDQNIPDFNPIPNETERKNEIQKHIDNLNSKNAILNHSISLSFHTILAFYSIFQGNGDYPEDYLQT